MQVHARETPTLLLPPPQDSSMGTSMVPVGQPCAGSGLRSPRSRQIDTKAASDSAEVFRPRRPKRRRRHAGSGTKTLWSRDNFHQIRSRCQEQPKNALMQLNELLPKDTGVRNSVKFRTITRSGPDHSPMYTASLEFNGQVYEGRGTTKKIAKQDAAGRVICSLIQFRRESEAVSQLELVMPAAAKRQTMTKHLNAVEDFTSDDTEGVAILFHRFDAIADDSRGVSNSASAFQKTPFEGSKLRELECVVNAADGEIDNRSSVQCQSSSDTRHFCGKHQSISPASVGLWSNPIAILNDLRPSAQCRILRDTRQDSKRCTKIQAASASEHVANEHPGPVVISMTVDGRQFVGSGRTLKSAKRRAATDVLHTLFRLRHIA